MPVRFTLAQDVPMIQKTGVGMKRVAVWAAAFVLAGSSVAWSADAGGAVCHTLSGPTSSAVAGSPASADAALHSAREFMRRGAWDQAICAARQAAQGYAAA